MNRRQIVFAVVAVTVALFATATFLYDRNASGPVASVPEYLERPHSPAFGPAKAAVTIVEFFDPACESCRAVYPFVKQILRDHPDDVRLVLRYAPFHDVSEEAVRILETARLQGKFAPVLDKLMETQPVWAAHHTPNILAAWTAAGNAGLDIAKAREEMNRPDITAILNRDKADIVTAKVRATPTFFVNGKPLTSLGRQQLLDLVKSELRRAGG
ncbi:MAG: DsbA family protein [Hyphomicrobiales bacterium]